MAEKEYIDREAFIRDKRAQYCADCRKRKGMKNGKERFIYDIGDAPCRSCGIDDMVDDLEDYPAADVRENVRGEWIKRQLPLPLSDGSRECVECSVCLTHWGGKYGFHFCPNCGARMDKDGDGE